MHGAGEAGLVKPVIKFPKQQSFKFGWKLCDKLKLIVSLDLNIFKYTLDA